MLWITGWWLTYPSEKWWTSSVGMMKIPIYGNHKVHWFQTTNQINIPAEALPAHENDENEYFVTARSGFFHWKPLQKKRSIYFVNNNPSMTSAWKRATATFSQIFFNVSAVVSIRFLPAHSHRHWKERMHFHIWGLRAWPFFVIIPPHPTPDYRMRMCAMAIEDQRA